MPVLSDHELNRLLDAAAYAAAGADLPVTFAPYTAPPRDVHVEFQSC